MDVAVHLGTLVAVMAYFRADMRRLAVGTGALARGDTKSDDARLARLLLIATIPAMAAGAILKVTGWIDLLRSIEVIGWATVLGAVLLWLADRRGPTGREAGDWTLGDAVAMGFAQALALIPGTSRSGITMTAARGLGFRRDEAARLSMLMAVPVILAAAGVETLGLIRHGSVDLGAGLLAGAVLSGLAAWAALAVMMRMFRADWTMTPFVIYRLALGAVLLALVYL